MSIGAGLNVPVCSPLTYNTVAASQTNQKLDKYNQGVGGALGDYLHHLLIIPATTAAGTITIKDGANAAITVFVTGTLADLKPIYLPIHAKSTNGAWQVTTGANVSVIAVGDFT